MLTKQQQEAVELCDRPVLIIAGPGTGKTTTICEKVRYLVEDKGFDPDSILALTFTDKAADEMSERIDQNLTKPFAARTFHSFAREMLEEFHQDIEGISEEFIVLDEAQTLLYFYENCESFKLSVLNNSNKRQVAYELRNTISKLKDHGVTLKKLEGIEFEDIQTKVDLMKVYASYEQFKRKNNFLDFADLLLLLLELLTTKPEVKKQISERFQYVLVDEFQDTNKLQLEILMQLEKEKLTLVGDPKQSIYHFRGAHYENFSLLEQCCPNLKKITLQSNFRSSPVIIETVNSLIEQIADINQKLVPTLSLEGFMGKFTVQDEFVQAQVLAQKIEDKANKSIAILCRRKSELGFLSRRLKEEGVDHELVQMNTFFDKELIKELLIILEILLSPKEYNAELFHLLNSIGLRQETVRRISRKASSKERSIYNVLTSETDFSEFEGERIVVKEFIQKINHLLKCIEAKNPIKELVREIVSKFSFYERAEYSKDREGIQALNSFIEFADNFSRIYKTNDLKRFIQICEFSKTLDIEVNPLESNANVQLMTYHQAKGKEFDVVFLPYLNERRFPSMYRRSLFETPFDQGKEDYFAEERRLFFVGISRAKQEVHFYSVKRFKDNKLNSKPSPLLKLLPEEIGHEQIAQQQYSYSLSPAESVKVEIYQRVKKHIINNQFDLAKKDIELLSQLFENKESLTSFISEKHPDLDGFKEKLKDRRKEPVKIDTSSFVYSVSQLQVYDSCPKKYLYQYIYRVPTQSKHYFDFGTSMHKVLEILIDDFDDKEMSKDKLYTKGVALMEKHWISKAYESVEQEQDYFDKGLVALKQFIDHEFELRNETKREVKEKENTFLLTFKGKKIQGIIDRVDETEKGYEVIDYKTSNSMESEKDLEKNMQLYVYARALENKYGKVPQKVGLWYLIHDKLVSVPYSVVDEELIQTKILGLIEQIESENFKPKPSFFACKFCDFNKICSDAKK